jgi:hypothetical protein
LRRALGAAAFLAGLVLIAQGCMTATGAGWASDVDLNRSGKIEVGLAFAALGLFLATSGSMLLRRRS